MTRLVIILIILTAMATGATLWIWNYPAVSYWAYSQAHNAGWFKIDEDDYQIAEFDFDEEYYALARDKYWNLIFSESPDVQLHSMLNYANCCLLTKHYYEAMWWHKKFATAPWSGIVEDMQMRKWVYKAYRLMALIYALSGDKDSMEAYLKYTEYVWDEIPKEERKNLQDFEDASKTCTEEYNRYLQEEPISAGLKGERTFLGLLTILFVMTPYCILVSMFINTYRKYGRRKDVYNQTSFGN